MRTLSMVGVLALGSCARHHDTDRGVGHHGPAGPTPAGLSHSSQKDSAQGTLVLKREADQLREMAERREREALILSHDPATDRELVDRNGNWRSACSQLRMRPIVRPRPSPVRSA